MDDNLILRNWRDLEQFGINVLTGESCALSIRLTVDLTTEEAIELIEEYLGGNIKIIRDTGWNARGHHTASIMLPRNAFEDLAAFCLVKQGYDTVVAVHCDGDGFYAHFVRPFEREEWLEERDRFFRIYEGQFRVYWIDGLEPHGKLRNQHTMSGRIE